MGIEECHWLSWYLTVKVRTVHTYLPGCQVRFLAKPKGRGTIALVGWVRLNRNAPEILFSHLPIISTFPRALSPVLGLRILTQFRRAWLVLGTWRAPRNLKHSYTLDSTYETGVVLWAESANGRQ
jgi:hypothetical protein